MSAPIQEDLNPKAQTPPITLRTLKAMADIDAAVWDRLATAGKGYNPFVSHTFLSLLEESGSVSREIGWLPCHITLERDETIIGVAPCYMKGHSQGEYIFDHHWGEAFERAGGHYYPKLLIASPFTPVPGPRLLCEDNRDIPLFAEAIAQMTEQMGVSSAHLNFITREESNSLAAAGFLPRIGEQFHWQNRDYKTFDDFLAVLSSRKRKTIRQERRKAMADGITIKNITGTDVTENLWDAFWVFYQDTGARKWGTPYLTRDAFTLLGERMSDDLMLSLAFHENSENPIAGALHMIGSDTLYGRYWGCTEQAKFLHFECCYYQAIEYAINRGLKRVEAGAQGHHKLARGYEPVATYSAHWIPDPSFRTAIKNYLDQERADTNQEIQMLKNFTPFKKNN